MILCRLNISPLFATIWKHFAAGRKFVCQNDGRFQWKSESLSTSQAGRCNCCWNRILWYSVGNSDSVIAAYKSKSLCLFALILANYYGLLYFANLQISYCTTSKISIHAYSDNMGQTIQYAYFRGSTVNGCKWYKAKRRFGHSVKIVEQLSSEFCMH